MGCEICGKKTADLFLISIEGTRMSVCSACSKHGTFISKVKIEEPVKEKPEEVEETETDLIENYSELIKKAREGKGISQEEFAKKLNESLSLVKKIELGKIRPTEKLCRKISRLLNIKLFQEVEKEKIEEKKPGEPLTLGDVLTLKKEKNE